MLRLFDTQSVEVSSPSLLLLSYISSLSFFCTHLPVGSRSIGRQTHKEVTRDFTVRRVHSLGPSDVFTKVLRSVSVVGGAAFRTDLDRFPAE